MQNLKDSQYLQVGNTTPLLRPTRQHTFSINAHRVCVARVGWRQMTLTNWLNLTWPVWNVSRRPGYLPRCLFFFYAIATVFQLFHGSDKMYEMRSRAITFYRLKVNFPHHIVMVLAFDEAVSYAQWGSGLQLNVIAVADICISVPTLRSNQFSKLPTPISRSARITWASRQVLASLLKLV